MNYHLTNTIRGYKIAVKYRGGVSAKRIFNMAVSMQVWYGGIGKFYLTETVKQLFGCESVLVLNYKKNEKVSEIRCRIKNSWR